MGADALRLIQQGEMEIGSHTLSHPLLHRLSPDERVLEIRESKSQLENVPGLAVESFAYPYGVYIPENVQEVIDAGYKTAVTVHLGVANHSNSPYVFSRKAISWGDSPIGFFHKL
jgi:peptidoglycan/xylan/chitin deacetylase (PgdA/CDA1 family)